jgi:hypothetical protein
MVPVLVNVIVQNFLSWVLSGKYRMMDYPNKRSFNEFLIPPYVLRKFVEQVVQTVVTDSKYAEISLISSEGQTSSTSEPKYPVSPYFFQPIIYQV